MLHAGAVMVARCPASLLQTANRGMPTRLYLASLCRCSLCSSAAPTSPVQTCRSCSETLHFPLAAVSHIKLLWRCRHTQHCRAVLFSDVAASLAASPPSARCNLIAFLCASVHGACNVAVPPVEPAAEEAAALRRGMQQGLIDLSGIKRHLANTFAMSAAVTSLLPAAATGQQQRSTASLQRASHQPLPEEEDSEHMCREHAAAETANRRCQTTYLLLVLAVATRRPPARSEQ